MVTLSFLHCLEAEPLVAARKHTHIVHSLMPSHKYLLRERALLAAVCVANAALAVSLPLTFQVATYLLVGGLLGLHHWRQQLLFAYVAIAALTLALLCEVVSYHIASPWLCALAMGGTVLGVSGSLVFPLPVNLSRVHGNYQTIGCVTTRLGGVDCRVFYPVAHRASAVDVTQRVPYVHHGQHLARGLSIMGKAPQWFFRPLYSAYLAAIQNAPVATPETPHGWPLVLFSHGLGGTLEIYATIVQELASRGNVVVILNHCDGSASVTRHDDGHYETIQPLPTPLADGDAFRFRNRQVCQRVLEVQRVLDAITALASSESSSSHSVFRAVDVQNVHIGGHSFGAATALSAADEDDRFCSALLHDAFMMPVATASAHGLGDRIPVLHLVSEHFLVERKENMEAIKTHTRGCMHPRTALLVLRKSHHNNFTDLPQFSPIVTRTMGAAGSIDPCYATLAIAQVSAAFVSGKRSIRDVQNQFPELVDG